MIGTTSTSASTTTSATTTTTTTTPMTTIPVPGKLTVFLLFITTD